MAFGAGISQYMYEAMVTHYTKGTQVNKGAVGDLQLHELRCFSCVGSEEHCVSWAKLHVSCEDWEISKVPSYCEIMVLRNSSDPIAILFGMLGSVSLSMCQKAAERQKGVQERKQKCWQVEVPGEILG